MLTPLKPPSSTQSVDGCEFRPIFVLIIKLQLTQVTAASSSFVTVETSDRSVIQARLKVVSCRDF